MHEQTTPFRIALTRAVGPWDISFVPEQLERLEAHYEAMVRANETMNLTRITDPIEAAIKHYADSLAILPWSQGAGIREANVLDVGTGAGFPAVPVAIMRPDWQITALDGTRKKVEFLRSVSHDLGLNHFSVEHAHSDHWQSDGRFELVLTRAVASLGQVMRTCRRFIRKNGLMVAYKTAKLTDEELEGARRAADELAMVIEKPFPYELRCGTEVLARALYTVRIA